MALEKSVIKAHVAESTSYSYKARELKVGIASVAKSFVAEDSFRSPDFKISELIAKQTGISQLEEDSYQDKINSQVLDRVQEIQEKAYKEGYELGLIEGSEKAFTEEKENLKTKLAHIEEILKRIEDLKSQILIDNEASIVRLAFLIAKKIALRDLEQHRDAVWEILKSVVGELQDDERVVVTLAEEDILFLESLKDKTNQPMESLKRVKFVPNENVKPGGCLIETEYGTVDATIEERVERTWMTLESRVPKKIQENKS